MRVLVVDDEEGIRRLLRAMLGILGHETITAGNGRQAIDCLSSNSGVIDTLVTDLKMPEMNGYITIREARRIQPSLAVVLMSGSLDAAAPKEAVFLPKPFTLASVSRCLDLAALKSRQGSARAEAPGLADSVNAAAARSLIPSQLAEGAGSAPRVESSCNGGLIAL